MAAIPDIPRMAWMNDSNTALERVPAAHTDAARVTLSVLRIPLVADAAANDTLAILREYKPGMVPATTWFLVPRDATVAHDDVRTLYEAMEHPTIMEPNSPEEVATEAALTHVLVYCAHFADTLKPAQDMSSDALAEPLLR